MFVNSFDETMPPVGSLLTHVGIKRFLSIIQCKGV